MALKSTEGTIFNSYLVPFSYWLIFRRSVCHFFLLVNEYTGILTQPLKNGMCTRQTFEKIFPEHMNTLFKNGEKFSRSFENLNEIHKLFKLQRKVNKQFRKISQNRKLCKIYQYIFALLPSVLRIRTFFAGFRSENFSRIRILHWLCKVA